MVRIPWYQKRVEIMGWLIWTGDLSAEETAKKKHRRLMGGGSRKKAVALVRGKWNHEGRRSGVGSLHGGAKVRTMRAAPGKPMSVGH